MTVNLREQIGALNAEINQLRRKRDGMIRLAQESCAHPIEQLVEGEYVPSSWGNAIPPFRVCRLCGYAEEGWGCGYWKLGAEPVPRLSRDEAIKHVLIEVIRQEKLSDLRFGRVTAEKTG